MSASPVKKMKAAGNAVKAANAFKVPVTGAAGASGLKVKKTVIKASNVRYNDDTKKKNISTNQTPVKKAQQVKQELQ